MCYTMHLVEKAPSTLMLSQLIDKSTFILPGQHTGQSFFPIAAPDV
jgi:hypothetical protein